ncbi:MAG: M1 family metallopeptidase, partial [Myxococcales bacterium]|nr:M1 family metallopeptidase [Myxococcales bacterium]
PSEERFSGEAAIRVRLAESRSTIWMHGRDLDVLSVEVQAEGGEAVQGSWEQVDPEGVCKLTLPSPIGPGEATIRLRYEASFDRSLRGLYRVDEAGESYAFTQFEAISARQAFPGFDEPAFKVPFEITLEVKADHVAAGNTPIESEEPLEGGMRRVRFARTRPMPTYLVAWAVGPLDVVEHAPIPANGVRSRPLPLRGLAVRGRGPKMAYALENTARILASLEDYFGREYPYAKLDLVAVPDFGAGAMENVGLVTFREAFLLIEEDAPEWQRRTYADITAHELAHMWFGNLVTMPWWDDVWLNEAFATWAAAKAIGQVFPDYHAELDLYEWARYAMSTDSLVSARQIRQPIESNDDIRNAFDSITYAKGGSVLSMLERWLGEEVFQEGIRHYLAQHEWGTATASDLMTALSEKAGRDVDAPFRSFLEQPGQPFIEASVSCEGERTTLSLRQSRYLPAGSTGERDRIWQVPVCVRYSVSGTLAEQCVLLTEVEAEIRLEASACPEWLMPNARGAGYYRFTMPPEQLEALRERGFSQLDAREKLAMADSLEAAFQSGALPAEALFAALPALARDPIRAVATMPSGPIGFGHARLMPDPASRARLHAFTRRVYGPLFRALGFVPGPDEDGERAMLRAEVLSVLAFQGQEPRVRREAARRAHAFLGYGRRGDGELHPDAVDSNLLGTVLAIAVQDGDAAFFDFVLARLLRTEDATLRMSLLGALGSTRDPALALRARGLALDERVRINEMGRTLRPQSRMIETREATWEWIEENFEALVARQGPSRGGHLPYYGRVYCSEQGAQRVEAFFAAPIEHEGGTRPRIETLPGGPRNLASTLESIRLCAARVEAQRESALRFFSGRR